MVDAVAVAFVNIQASGRGPDSWPIEVGWAFGTGEARALLVKPAATWSMQSWAKSAEALHRISPMRLIAEGRDLLDVATMLNAGLARMHVYSDAPDYDSYWLFRLYEGAGITPSFRLHLFSDLIGPLWTRSAAELATLAAQRAPLQHRAGPNVLHMQAMYQIARGAGG